MSLECVYGLQWRHQLPPSPAVPITVEQARSHKLTFGKHKGKPITIVPSGYLRWLVSNHGPQQIPLAAIRAARLLLDS